jgi:hypothetical protein
MNPGGFILPPIPPEEMTPTVKLLLTIIEQQQTHSKQQQALSEHQQSIIAQQQDIITQLEHRVEQLEAEMARLKKLPARPRIKPSTLDKDPDDDPPTGSAGTGRSTKDGQRPGSKKRSKRTPIHRTQVILPQNLPAGSRLLGYQDYLIQDMVIEPCNTQYRLARYRTPDGRLLTGRLPLHCHGSHFGPTLQSFILYQYHHQRVTQPLLLQQCRAWGIDLSSGQLNRIITEGKDRFHAEKTDLLSAGIDHSSYLHVDDTGARHGGKNGVCTHIGNELFAYFQSTSSKNRINFLTLLCGPNRDYVINQNAIDYMQQQKLPAAPIRVLQQGTEHLPDETAWRAQLNALGIEQPRHVRIATEGALIGSLIHHGFPTDLVILSDDAGQFDVFLHALCWIHADRIFKRILPLNDIHVKALNWVRQQIWDLYRDLKHYRQQPSEAEKHELSARFDEICRTKTRFQTLNLALQRLAKNKTELLLVLERPDIPLHNNLSERDIREYVIKRKISGSTRSDAGRQCRDTFASLKKTCQKQRISFWDYLLDRLSLTNTIPYLPDLIRGSATLSP